MSDSTGYRKTNTKILSLLILLILPTALSTAVSAADRSAPAPIASRTTDHMLASVPERWCRISLYGCYPGRLCPGHEVRQWCDHGLWWEEIHGGRRGPARRV